MKLTIEEGNYLEAIIGRARNLYGSRWEQILSQDALPMPKKGFSALEDSLEEFDIHKEEKVIEQLQEKNILRVKKHEMDIEKEGSFEQKYSDQSEYFIGLNENKMEGLKQQLSL